MVNEERYVPMKVGITPNNGYQSRRGLARYNNNANGDELSGLVNDDRARIERREIVGPFYSYGYFPGAYVHYESRCSWFTRTTWK